MKEHAIQIQIEELEGGWFLATSDDVQGLVAQGRTLSETLDIARDVAQKLIETRRERGDFSDLQNSPSIRDYTIVIAA